MKLYKYLPRKYLKAFFQSGSLKVGTLYEYRDIEKYGHVIGDKDEGFHKTEFSLAGGGEFDLQDGSVEANFFREHILRPDQMNLQVKIKLVDGVKIISESRSPDLYVYCVSSEFNADAMEQFGCDSCLEIVNPAGFFRAISHKIRHKGTLDGLHEIQYLGKETHYTQPHQHHPSVMKDPEFRYQKEWRAIWNPIKIPRGPLFLNVPKAIQHCRVYAP